MEDWTSEAGLLPAEAISDHDYVRNLLRQSIEELSSDPQLPNDDGSDCDKAIEEYWPTAPLSTEALKEMELVAGKLVRSAFMRIYSATSDEPLQHGCTASHLQITLFTF